jgi:hypothetical protein
MLKNVEFQVPDVVKTVPAWVITNRITEVTDLLNCTTAIITAKKPITNNKLIKQLRNNTAGSVIARFYTNKLKYKIRKQQCKN